MAQMREWLVSRWNRKAVSRWVPLYISWVVRARDDCVSAAGAASAPNHPKSPLLNNFGRRERFETRHDRAIGAAP
jgi:hypothetical protein